MNNIAPKRVVSRRANQLYTISFLIGAVGVFLIALGLLMILVPLDDPAHSTYPLYRFARGAFVGIGILAIVFAFVLTTRAATYRKDNDLAHMTAQYLEPILNNRFTFIRSLNRRSIGYVDALLIGPPGVLVFRLVGSTGAFFNEGGNWLKRDTSGEWKPAGFSPTREDLADIRKLREHLTRRNLGDVPLFGVVVFTEDPQRVALQSKDGQLPITHLINLYTTMQNGYLIALPMDAVRVDAIVQSLIV